MSHSPIPQYAPETTTEEAEAVQRYMAGGGWLTEFTVTTDWEKSLADFFGARHCILTTSGSAGLVMGLWALGVRAGDEVIVPDLTMAATASSVVFLGAKPVFAEIERASLTLCPTSLAQTISPKTRAVIHVSLNGRAGSLDAVKRICASRNLPLLEDAAQAMGSFHNGIHLGLHGACGVFSFSSPKIISTGQGGAIVTNDDELALSLRRLKNFGRESGGADVYDNLGFNFKFTDLQATVGLAQMPRLKERMALKKRMWAEYLAQLEGVTGLEVLPMNLETTSPWFMEIVADRRQELITHLKELGIGARPIYPALHSERAFCAEGEFPISSWAAASGLWLPSSFSLSPSQLTRICSAIREFYRS